MASTTPTTSTPALRHVVRNGRRIAVHTLHIGASGKTVVFCHPAPGSGLIDPDPAITAGMDVTLLAVDRPGFGASDPVAPNQWATVDSSADDIAFVLNELGIGTVGVAGWSAGGRVALALAARHPHMVDRVVVQGTPAPHEEVPWVEPDLYNGLMQLEPLPVQDARAALTAMFEDASEGMPPDEVLLAMLGGSAADDAVLSRPGARNRVIAMLHGAFAQGVAGIVDDILGPNLQPWGFRLDDVRTKVLLQYGDDDPITGYAHGKWWQSQLPEAKLEMVPDVGHMVALAGWKRALAFLTA
jgi:pimeloyl-ACP methyl ester carboxylesterase